MPARQKPKAETPCSPRWTVEDKVLHIPNQWSLIGRLFLAPFLVFGLVLLGVGITGLVILIYRGNSDNLVKELLAGLGMAGLGALIAVPCWIGVFSWSDIVIDGRKRVVRIVEGAWPRIKRWTEKASGLRAVSIQEQELMSDSDGGGSSVTKQAVQLIRADSKAKPFVLERCDSYTEAHALATAAGRLLGLPLVIRKD